jgi:hypothetical protein
VDVAPNVKGALAEEVEPVLEIEPEEVLRRG